MIIPVWDDHEQPKEDLEIQSAAVPRMEYRRLLAKDLTLASLATIYQALIEADIPADAILEFQQWNSPESNWYIHARWVGDGG